MNEKLIDNVIRDYSLRELQMHSSRILSNYNATNMFIKQFRADYDSQQFYKNVIKWFVQKEKCFPEEHVLISHEERYWERGYFEKNNLRFVFPVNEPGLGDRFVMTSNILSTINHLTPVLYRDKHCVVDLFLKPHPDTPQEQYLNFIDFYDVIDFFHFERPQEKITTNVIDEGPPPYKEMQGKRRKLNKRLRRNKIIHAEKQNDCHNYNMRLDEYMRSNYFLFNHGKYWPITYDKTVKKKFITFIFYVKDDPDRQFEHKFITTEEERLFNKIMKDYHFVRLEDYNFKRNVELLSQSHFVIASEGMWTHLSRAMNIDTIAYTKDDVFINEFNSQGYFASENFEECLTKLKEKCIDLKI
jgi:hypothetical protein